MTPLNVDDGDEGSRGGSYNGTQELVQDDAMFLIEKSRD